ncbi:MAG: hypothetical protein IPK84_00820 [Candidatus Moraniibacteriota bacterium]|nr:MAG: hypothetical protein IPK84_00820 [Candidatus Moranbacteria bacterium]
MYKEIILEALKKVVTENGYMVGDCNRDIHEQSLSHRLAHYLENSGHFSGYNIDCEYNRFEERSKRNSQNDLIKPDIVIHSRGNQNDNLIIIQTKKFNDSADEIENAKTDLKNDKGHLNYKFAFLIIFPEKMDCNFEDIIFEY